MRRTIGKRLLESKQQLPHYYLSVEVNMGESKLGYVFQIMLTPRPSDEASRVVQQGWRGKDEAFSQ